MNITTKQFQILTDVHLVWDFLTDIYDREKGSGVAAVPVKDTLKEADAAIRFPSVACCPDPGALGTANAHAVLPALFHITGIGFQDFLFRSHQSVRHGHGKCIHRKSGTEQNTVNKK